MIIHFIKQLIHTLKYLLIQAADIKYPTITHKNLQFTSLII
ncbi:hypothetical protein BVRB_6g130530 [Beta vulgaris subsp. vulgaris]|nr:hypothetical protein BVRB_6g130530 [Beta vulgaris subsp. vulgaris]